jgi:release factor glutamine methyltransferase
MLGSAREARWIVEEATQRVSRPDDAAGIEEMARDLAERRRRGEPLQHVFGHWSFRTLDVFVDKRALVPRPETEVVVEVALDELRRLAAAAPARCLQIADLGTGSGVIALAVAAELETTGVIHATDRSEAALALAAANVRRVAGSITSDARMAIELHQGAWFDALPDHLAGSLDLVVSNPPYVSEKEWSELEPVVRGHDPKEALVAGPTGLECLEHLVTTAPRWLSAEGSLVLEIAPSQRERVLELAGRARLGTAQVREDLAGRPRVLLARR